MAVKKKPKQGALTRRADRYFSLYIRARDKVCQHCGNSQHLQCAHGFSRRYHATRWYRQNAFALCRACHVYFTHRPLEWEVWLREWWGDEEYVEIRHLAMGIFDGDKVGIAAEYKRLYEELVHQEVTG